MNHPFFQKKKKQRVKSLKKKKKLKSSKDQKEVKESYFITSYFSKFYKFSSQIRMLFFIYLFF